MPRWTKEDGQTFDYWYYAEHEDEGLVYLQFFDNTDEYIDTDVISPNEWRDMQYEQKILAERYGAIDVYDQQIFSDTELYDRALAKIPTLVEPFLPRSGIGLIYGEAEVGKSFLSAQLAACVIGGEDFLGYTTHKSSVLIIQADMAGQLQHERVKLQPYKPVGLDYLLGVKTVPFQWQEKDQVVKDINDKKYDMIIFDTLRQIHPLDENDSKSVQNVYNKLRRLFGPDPSLVFIHHSRKPTQDGILTSRNFRGSSAWVDDADWAIELKKQDSSSVRLMRFEKARICRKPKPSEVVLDNSTLRFELVPKGSATRRTTETSKKVAELVEDGMTQRTAYRKVTGK